MLDQFRATTKRDLGARFERLIANDLVTNPQYATRFSARHA